MALAEAVAPSESVTTTSYVVRVAGVATGSAMFDADNLSAGVQENEYGGEPPSTCTERFDDCPRLIVGGFACDNWSARLQPSGRAVELAHSV